MANFIRSLATLLMLGLLCSFSNNLTAQNGCTSRVTDHLRALYDFKEGSGSTVHDVSGVGTPLNLQIHNPNNTHWLNGSCGLSINSSTIIRSINNASKISQAVKNSNAITVETWVMPHNTTQAGPARILTISENTGLRNVTLGQAQDDYSIRMRTTTATDNGLPEEFAHGTASTALKHVVYTRNSAGHERLYVNGVLEYSGTRGGNTSNWETHCDLALGNEMTLDRPWLGKLYLAAVYSKALSQGEVTQNYQAGECCSSAAPNAPSLTCNNGDFNWEGEVQMINSGNLRYTLNLPNSFHNASSVDVSEVITGDSYAGRQNVTQPHERVRLVFRKNGATVAQTGFTDDVQDFVQTAYEVGSLGTVNLPNGADQVMVVHFNDPQLGGNAFNFGPNSVDIRGICLKINSNNNGDNDYGDAPASYGSICYELDCGTPSWLGGAPDGEAGMQSNAQANGDDQNGDDEDGVNFIGGTTINSGATKSIAIAYTTQDFVDSWISGWIDFNRNGVFDANEQVIDDFFVQPLTSGTQTFNINVPNFTDCGVSYARFIITSDQNEGPTGLYCLEPNACNDGEVEDYQVNLDGCTVPQCDITATVTNIQCDDNGTPSDPSDDIASFSLTVTGDNTSFFWSSTINGVAASGFYGIPQTFTFPISNGNLNFIVRDFSDATCTDNVTVNAPATCSNQPLPASVGDLVFEDTNGNGVRDANEPGIQGVTVKLQAPDGTTLQTTTTNAAGFYQFTNLTPGDYKIMFNTPNGFTPTPQSGTASSGVNNNSDNDPATQMTDVFNLASGENDPTIDAGFIPDPDPASVGNHVFEDTNGNGIKDAGEPGIQGVTVKLQAPDGTTLQTTTTDATGFYEFTNLTPGDYKIMFNTPAGFTPTAQSGNANSGVDNNSDNDPATQMTDVFDLAAGENDPTIDAGFVPDQNPASVGDLVFEDTNGNGVRDANEPGIQGVTVKLQAPDGTTLQTTTTNAAGFYQFTNLTPGDYKIMFNTPNGFTPTAQSGNASSGINNNSDNDPATQMTDVFNLASGENDPTIDAGFIPSNACDNVTNGGTIGFGNTCENMTLVCNQNVPTIQNCIAPSGGTGALEIIWLQATNNPNCNPPTQTIDNINNDPLWSVIAGETGLTLSPGAITDKTCYLRCARRANCDMYIESNIIMADLDPNCGGGGGGTPDCADISITGGAGTITVSGLDGAPISSLQIFNASWNQEFSCFANCSATETVNVAAGTYYVYAKYYTAAYALICQEAQTVTVTSGGGGGGGNPCDGQGGDADNDGVCAAQDCDDNDPNVPATEGSTCDDGNANTTNDVIQSDGCTCAGTPSGGGGGGNGGDPDCADISITTGNGNIVIGGLDGAPITSVQVFTSAWQAVYQCFADCASPTETIDVPNGDYLVYVKYYDASYSLICQVDGTYTVGGNGGGGGGNPCDTAGGDADNDGVCAADDCDDNDPSVPATVGSACNDGDANTTNDVIQSDGCTCAGTPDGGGGGGGNGGDPDCANILIEAGSNSIVVSGLDGAPISSLQIFNGQWQQEYSCFADCGATETVTVAAGTYYVYAKYYTAGYTLICETTETLTVTAGGGGGGGNTCDNLTYGGEIGFFSHCAASDVYCPGNGNVEAINSCELPSGGTGAIEYVWLKSTTTSAPPTSTTNDPNWAIIAGATADNYQPAPVSQTTYFIRCARRAGCVNYVGESNVVTVSVDPNCNGGGGGGGTTDPNCGDITVTANNGNIIVTGLDGAPVTSVQVFTSAWAGEYSCFGDCNTPTESISVSDGTYYVYVKYYTAAYSLICSVDETINVVNGQALVVNTNDGDAATAAAVLDNRSTTATTDLEHTAAANLTKVDFTVFPNPASQQVNLAVANLVGKAAEIHIYNQLGMRVQTISVEAFEEDVYRLDLTDLQDGYYTIWLNVPGHRPVAKPLMIGRL